MSDLIPKQLRIIHRLRDLLEEINPTNVNPGWEQVGLTPQNYVTDLRKKVFIGKTTIGTDVVLPAVAILESPTPVAALHAGEGENVKSEKWRLLLQGFAVEDRENPTVPAYLLKAEVELRLSRISAMQEGRGKPLYPEDYRLSGLIGGLQIPQGVVRPPEDKVSSTGFFYIPLVVSLTTDSSKPYEE